MTISNERKQRQGTLRPCRLNNCGTGVPLQRLPLPPPGLQPLGAEAWDLAGEAAIELGTLMATDLTLLEVLARSWGLSVELELEARQEGFTIAGSRGQQRINPLLVESRACRIETARLLASFGLSPKSRTSVDTAGYNPTSNKWADLDRRE